MGNYVYRLMEKTVQSDAGEIGVYDFTYKKSLSWTDAKINEQCFYLLISPSVKYWEQRGNIPDKVIMSGGLALADRGMVIPVYRNIGHAWYEDVDSLEPIGQLVRNCGIYVFTPFKDIL